MAIIDCIEEWKGRNAEGDVQHGYGTRIFIVTFDVGDSPELRPFMARDAYWFGFPIMPQIGNIHPYHPRIWAQRKSVVPFEGPLSYEVTVYYSSEPYRSYENSPAEFDDPLNAPSKISWSFITSNEPVDRDIHGNPILNSAQESFNTPITKEFHDQVLRVIKAQETFNAVRAYDYMGSLNSNTFYGCPPGTMKCTTFDGEEARSVNLIYWIITYEFQYRADGWKRKVLDEGYRVKTGTIDGMNTYQTILDKEGNPLSQPTLLDGYGNKMQASALGVWLEFDIYPSKNFSLLGL